MLSGSVRTRRAGERTVCIDEMTGFKPWNASTRTNPCVQVSANAKSLSTFATAPSRPSWRSPPGKRRLRLDCQFRCRSWRGDSGSVGATRTEADYLEHVKQTVATDPQANKCFYGLLKHPSIRIFSVMWQKLRGLTWIWVKGESGILNPCKPAPPS